MTGAHDQGRTQFPLVLPLGTEPGNITIYSHAVETAAGTIDCWSYVTQGLQPLGHREIVITVKRERDEPPGAFPGEAIEIIRLLIPVIRNGSVVTEGGFSQLSGAGLFGGHLMYIEAQPLPGIEVPTSALAAIVITDDELETLKAYGPLRVMARLGRQAAYYPCPPWSDRNRVRCARPPGSQTILERVARRRVSGATVLWDRRDVRISVSSNAQAILQKTLASWSFDVPLGLLTDRSPHADACLVWEPGLTGLNAIVDRSGKAEQIAGCFILIVARQARNGIAVIEDGLGLMLTDEAAAALRDALMNGREMNVECGEGRLIVESPGGGEARRVEILLLNSDNELAARGVTAGILSFYIKELMRLLERAATSGDLPEPFGVYVTVRPGRRSRVWNTSSTVRQQLEAIQAPSVEGGPIAIGLRSRRFAPENINESLPEEWAQAVREISARTGQTGVSLDETLDYVWP